MMKQKNIYMKAWLDEHGRLKAVDTDQWYLDFANSLLPVVSDSNRYKEKATEKKVVLMLAMYLEDCVADGGNWRRFVRWHKESYGRYLPFYSLTEDYLADEINREDISFLLWAGTPTEKEDFFWLEDPMDEGLLALSEEIYNRMDAVFELAPISDDLAADWLMETELMEKKRQPLPVVVPGEKLPTNVEHFLEASHGEPLMYFDSYDSLKLFLVQGLKWEDDDESLLPDLEEFDNFVLYANPKGLLIGLDVAPYFADERNPMYSEMAGEIEAYELFCEGGLCPFDLLKYGMEHHLLPDAQFPFENGKAMLQENWDFVARWFLGEYYEGE